MRTAIIAILVGTFFCARSFAAPSAALELSESDAAAYAASVPSTFNAGGQTFSLFSSSVSATIFHYQWRDSLGQTAIHLDGGGTRLIRVRDIATNSQVQWYLGNDLTQANVLVGASNFSKFAPLLDSSSPSSIGSAMMVPGFVSTVPSVPEPAGLAFVSPFLWALSRRRRQRLAVGV